MLGGRRRGGVRVDRRRARAFRRCAMLGGWGGGRVLRARGRKGAVAPFGDEAFEEVEELGGAGDVAPEEDEELGTGALTRCDVSDGGPQVGEGGADGGGEAVH